MSSGEVAYSRRLVTSTGGGIRIELAQRDVPFIERAKLRREASRKLVWRWVKFNLVGVVGIGVQLAVLWIFTHMLRCNYLVSTALAVETAVLHNFFWHQRFTWVDRTRGPWRGSFRRLVKFNITNGMVSIAGNVMLMRVLVGGLHLRVLIANMLSIAAGSAVNFGLSELYVFRARAISPRRRGDTEEASELC